MIKKLIFRDSSYCLSINEADSPEWPGEISDGFHTFNELYRHRCLLFALVCNLTYGRIRSSRKLAGRVDFLPWKSRKHHDGSTFEGWFIAGLTTDELQQITYHCPNDLWDTFHVPETERAPLFDGHTSHDVLDRLTMWARSFLHIKR